jgi:predicted RND superfamily exporter protein
MLVITLASFAPIQYFGLLLAIALLTTTLSTLFTLPSFIIAFHIFQHATKKKEHKGYLKQ